MKLFSTLLAALIAGLLISGPVTASGGKPGSGEARAQICPKAQTGWDARKLVGKRLGKATRIAAKRGCSIRVLRVNGEDQAGTDDYVTTRINVAIRGEKRRIVRILGIG